MKVFGTKPLRTITYLGALAAIGGLFMLGRGMFINPWQPDNKRLHDIAPVLAQRADAGDYRAWCRAMIRKDPQVAWAGLRADTPWANVEKIAIFLSEWLAKDPTSATIAFGEFARSQPRLIGEVAVLCGEYCPSGQWAVIEKIAKEKLAGLELRALMLVVARGMARDGSTQALKTLDSLGGPGTDNLRGAQFEVRGRVVEALAKRDFSLALDWLSHHNSWDPEWPALCRAVGTNGLDTLPASDLSSLLARLPYPSADGVRAMMCVDASRNPAAALKLLHALDATGTKMKDPALRSGVISALTEAIPEVFDSSYFTEGNANDAFFVGRARKIGMLEDDLTWAQSLGTSAASDEAVRGIVHSMMTTNSYLASQQIGALTDDQPQKRTAIAAMVEWLTSSGNLREAAAWRSHLEQTK